ncbi:hypothetical protein [Sporosarcina sp. FA9]|uniref:hypothetical protein n=1 Tax=Sporosarcina sp. FA9 TaxID=3413030 RepID=UPI003F657B4F
MSLFFEDEIRKVAESMDDAELENLLSQDPRRKQHWKSRNRNNNSRKMHRPDKRRWDADDDNMN